jgi:hypothetical protein
MLLCVPSRADMRRVSTQHTVEVEIADLGGSSANRVQRIVTTILESGMPLPDLDPAGDLTPDVVDSIQAAILRVELSKQGCAVGALL